jgi:hypothetical protein
MRHEKDRASAESGSNGASSGPSDRAQADKSAIEDDFDFAAEHTPSATDPPNAEPDDANPDERWDKPTEV